MARYCLSEGGFKKTSVIVAIKKDGKVYLGCDSQVSLGGTRSTLKNPSNYKSEKSTEQVGA